MLQRSSDGLMLVDAPMRVVSTWIALLARLAAARRDRLALHERQDDLRLLHQDRRVPALGHQDELRSRDDPLELLGAPERGLGIQGGLVDEGGALDVCGVVTPSLLAKDAYLLNNTTVAAVEPVQMGVDQLAHKVRVGVHFREVRAKLLIGIRLAILEVHLVGAAEARVHGLVLGRRREHLEHEAAHHAGLAPTVTQREQCRGAFR